MVKKGGLIFGVSVALIVLMSVLGMSQETESGQMSEDEDIVFDEEGRPLYQKGELIVEFVEEEIDDLFEDIKELIEKNGDKK